MIYLKIIAIALVLFVFLRSLSSLFAMLASRKIFRMLFLRIFPVIEMTLWLSYIFWASNQIFKESAVYPLLSGSIIIVLVAIFGWYLLRDFISGIILKSENAFEPGQKIKTNLVSGTIKKLGYRSIEITGDEGETVKVPFSQLSSSYINKPADKGEWVGQIIKLKISTGYPADKVRDILEKRILEMPWIISGDQIKTKITREEEGKYLAEVTFHSLSPEMALKTEENLQVFIREVFA